MLNSADHKLLVKEFDKRLMFQKRSRYSKLASLPFSWALTIFLGKIMGFFGRSLLINVSTFWGDRMKVLLPDYNGLAVFLYSFTEADLVEYLLYNIGPGDTFIDGGAHWGYYSLLANFLVGHLGKVHSFEPGVGNFKILSQNTIGKENIYINQMALWENNGVIDFYDCGEMNPTLNSVKKSAIAHLSHKKIITQATTLDDYCLRNHVAPSFIKLDTEQSELEILRGAKSILKRYGPQLIVETWGKTEKEENYTRSLVKLLDEYDYNPYTYTDHHLIPWKYTTQFVGNLIFLRR